MQRIIRYGEARIGFSIRFVPKQCRRVTINVLPDGGVYVDAPEDATPEAVTEAVRRRARWLWQVLENQQAGRRYVLPREYVSGESHFYLGRRYLLKVVVASGHETGVKLLRGQLQVMTNRVDAAVVRCLLDDWYRQRAREVFARRVAERAAGIGWLAGPPAFRLQNMRTQWGSCSPAGMLVLNPQLIKAPRDCVDYVINHELCHLREHNHSPNYYRLLDRLMPDWQIHKQRLDGLAEMLLNR